MRLIRKRSPQKQVSSGRRTRQRIGEPERVASSAPEVRTLVPAEGAATHDLDAPGSPSSAPAVAAATDGSDAPGLPRPLATELDQVGPSVPELLTPVSSPATPLAEAAPQVAPGSPMPLANDAESGGAAEPTPLCDDDPCASEEAPLSDMGVAAAGAESTDLSGPAAGPAAPSDREAEVLLSSTGAHAV